MADVAPSVSEPPHQGCPIRVAPLRCDRLTHAPPLLGAHVAMVSLRLAAMVRLPLVQTVRVFSLHYRN
jgi:hypothetical protein